MDLSIIIVNYNVKYFLKQCIHSVERAIKNIDAEIFVVDNKSTDGSVAMVEKFFPTVKLIANKDNVGFSRANNQAIDISNGKYVLLLNPDTVVAEDTFEKVLNFMNKTPKAGGLGVKMVDGNGNFLPESKRGLPTPEVAFYKIFGLSSLFPKSKTFAKYHLGNLPQMETNKIDILSGAFMFLRKETLNKVGTLDETFFMYGEDIDLSYRIVLGGYENYYFPHSSIIHYKGESTKKSSVNYVFIFYKAMAIFAEKHFGKSKAGLFNALIKLAIFFRAGLAIFNRFIEIIFLPLIDSIVLIGGLHFIKRIYQVENGIYHDSFVAHTSIISLSIITVLTLLFSGGYDKPVKFINIIKGIVLATPLIFISFLIFQKNFFISQSQSILTIVGAGLFLILVRITLHILGIYKFKINNNSKRVLLIGEEEEINQTETLISLTQENARLKRISNNDILQVQNLKRLLIDKRIARPKEIIFGTKGISYGKIIELMMSYKRKDIDFKIAHPQDKFIIGSTNLNTSGELYTLKIKGIKSSSSKRLKRTFDISTSALMLILSPILILFIQNKPQFYSNLWQVLIGQLSFVGYDTTGSTKNLPNLNKSIFSFYEFICHNLNSKKINPSQLNTIYARDYSVSMDLKVVFNLFKKLDKKV